MTRPFVPFSRHEHRPDFVRHMPRDWTLDKPRRHFGDTVAGGVALFGFLVLVGISLHEYITYDLSPVGAVAAAKCE